MNNISLFLSKTVATVFFIGYIPFAPGTFGSLAGLGFVWLLSPDLYQQTVILIAGFFIGVLSSHIVEKDSGEKDSRNIVIDEFVGYNASVLFLPLTIEYLFAAFILFRLLDILKPPPIRNVEIGLKGGIGIMIDDLMAGVFVNIILQVWRII